MLVWVALFSLSPKGRPDRRRFRQRHHLFSLEWLYRLVGVLIFVRAVEIARVVGTPRAPRRDFSPAGFHHRIRVGGMMRASLGSRLRAALRHRDPRERIVRLLAAIGDLDGYARRYLVPRILRRFTKLRAIIIAAPRVCTLARLFAPAPIAADSS